MTLRLQLPIAAALAVFAATSAPAQAQCSPNIVFFEDFEGPLAGWTMTGDWQIRPPSACLTSCATGLTAGLELNNGPGCRCDKGPPGVTTCEGDLTSPWIDLPALAPGDHLELFFCADLYKLFNCFADPTGIADCHRMRVEAQGGASKQFLLLDGSDLSPSCPGPFVAPPFDLTDFGG